MKNIIFLLLISVSVIACKPREPEPRPPVSQKSGSYIKESIKMNKKLVAEEEEIINRIIAQDSGTTYHASNDGFWYFYHIKDTTTAPTPAFGDVVKFNYDLRTLQDQTIYSEDELSPRKYSIDKEELFSGLRQGLKLMKPGEKVTFIFPSHKGFGYYGDKDRIGTNVPLKSTVTLLEIQPVTNLDTLKTINQEP